MELDVLQLPDINPEDTCYRATDGTVVKVRMKQDPMDYAPPEVRRSCIALHFSASLCDEQGKALTDATDPLGYQIAPAEPLTIQLQGMRDKAQAEGVALDVVIEQVIDAFRRKQAVDALTFRSVLALRGKFVSM